MLKEQKLIHSSQQPLETVLTVLPISQMWKRRHREACPGNRVSDGEPGHELRQSASC